MVNVGEVIPLQAEWVKDGSEVTTGTATATIHYVSSGAIVQESPVSLTYDATDKWNAAYTVPEALRGKVFNVDYRHSDTTLPPLVEPFEVSSGPGDGGHLTVHIA